MARCYPPTMPDKSATASEIIQRLVELDDDILREARRDYYQRDYERLERLIEEQSSLERRLKRLDEE